MHMSLCVSETMFAAQIKQMLWSFMQRQQDLLIQCNRVQHDFG